MLQAADLVFGYGGTPVLHGVSLSIPAGGLVGLIGPNGSGKTTLLRLLAGTRRAVRGEVTLNGVPIAGLSRIEIARRLAVVAQETHLAYDYTVLEVVLMGRYAHLGAFEIEGPRDEAIARAALAATGVEPFAARPFSTLSGGEKQRVIIAAALAQITDASGTHSPGSMLLLDEPTAALDLKYQLGVISLLERLHRERNLTVVVSTHDLTLAARLCTAIVMLKDGRVIASGTTEEVMTAERIGELYEVDVDVVRHPASGAITVVPVGPASGGRHS